MENIISKYEVEMEISGKFAFFSNPSSGGGFVTYPIPTFSACKGICESILRLMNVNIVPYKIDICSPIKTMEMTNNYHGILRKPDLVTKKAASQITRTILCDVCYKIYAYPISINRCKKYEGINSEHSYHDQFIRRLIRGRHYSTPYLGTSECMPDYCGPIRDTTSAIQEINFVIPNILHMSFSSLSNGIFSPAYLNNLIVKNGTVYYPLISR